MGIGDWGLGIGDEGMAVVADAERGVGETQTDIAQSADK